LRLNLRSSGIVSALTFSPDGRTLVIGALNPARVSFWQIEYGRGIQTLRGLTSQASRLCFSPDGRFLAGLGHKRDLAVWDVANGHVKQLLLAPAVNIDNDAGLAFSPDAARLACSAGEEAKLWEVASGNELHSWRLPAGFKDALAFDAAGKVWSFRGETATAEQDSPKAVIHCRIRNLSSDDWLRPSLEIAAFNRHFFGVAASPNGATFVAEGIHESRDGRYRSIRAYDAVKGRELWSLISTRSTLTGELTMDADGTAVAIRQDNHPGPAALIELASGKSIGTIPVFPICASPSADMVVTTGAQDPSGQARGYLLSRRGKPTSGVILGLETTPFFQPAFSCDGRQFAWSNDGGTVSLCDLEQLQARLKSVGLEW
jgi:hypothetical protein